MITFFDFNSIKKEAKDSSKKFITILDVLHNKKLPNLRTGVPHVRSKLSGSSFILNLSKLLENCKNYDPDHVVQYIELCSKRDYLLYKAYGIKELDLSFYPDIKLEVIKHNPLLHIVKNKIYFKYE